MKIMATSFKRTCACTVVFSAPTLQQATVDPCLCQRLLDTRRQVWLNLLWGHFFFLLAADVHKVLFVPSKSLFPWSCVSAVIKSHWPPKSNSLGVFFGGEARWWSRSMCAHLLLWELQNCNSLLNNHPQENVGSHQKKVPHIQGQRRSPSKMVGGVKLHLESNPIPARDTWRDKPKPCAHQEPETPQKPSQTCLWVFECLLQRYGSAAACHRDRGSGWSRPTSHSVWHKPF